MAGATDKGSCTWTFANGIWTAVDNCKSGATCVGPIPLSPADVPKIHSDAAGHMTAPDDVVQNWRKHSQILKDNIPDSPVADNTVVVIPCE
jgi:hypothetical protein